MLVADLLVGAIRPSDLVLVVPLVLTCGAVLVSD